MKNAALVAGMAAATKEALRIQKAFYDAELDGLRAEMQELRSLVPTVRDGEPGPAGATGAPGEPGRDGERGEPGERGEAGRDGRDGVASLDEIKALATAAVDERLEAVVEKRVAEAIAALPTMQYKGSFAEGQVYRAGDVVTWAGAMWHADTATSKKPGQGADDGWTLAVKRGRDGRDATREAVR
jgi:hypothetical protein